MDTKVYIAGEKMFKFVCKISESSLPQLSPVSKIIDPRKIAVGCQIRCLVWKGTNKLELHQQFRKIRFYEIPNEKIKNICSGHSYSLILTESGMAYTLPSKIKNKISWDLAVPLNFFTENNLFIKSIKMSYSRNYFLCKKGKLFSCKSDPFCNFVPQKSKQKTKNKK
ncbi:hypothetical protein M0812_06295 [Anaeramoeba flamelloides]|uniref:Uncharacterized protein n=1 Tax=Anaeramoeba flamelloides TaxID=1746091 RepID=A0AAV8A771_9EUKA|nr:hypothetical protein M0812_06295 [Anaeramoeba flamelloides]